MKKVIELFSGNADITKALKEAGVNCISLDYNPKFKPDICKDVYTLTEEDLKEYSFIWLSPDCTTYSFASHGLHRKKGQVPVSDYAKECDENNRKLFALLNKLDIPFIAENPRAHFGHMDFVKGLSSCVVYFSSYGAPYTKPTQLFTNRPELLKHFDTTVSRGTTHLDYVVSNYKNFLGRCKIPERLINDIVKAVKEAIS